MSGIQGSLPYEECRRGRRQALPAGRTPLHLPYALPPFHPGTPTTPDSPVPPPGPAPARLPAPRRRVRRRRVRPVDDARMSGLLGVLCLTALLAAIVFAALRPRG
ncbi:hypothetical protein [Streptomyces sp. NPDC001135]